MKIRCEVVMKDNVTVYINVKYTPISEIRVTIFTTRDAYSVSQVKIFSAVRAHLIIQQPATRPVGKLPPSV
jgi:hypothetical protein